MSSSICELTAAPAVTGRDLSHFSGQRSRTTADLRRSERDAEYSRGGTNYRPRRRQIMDTVPSVSEPAVCAFDQRPWASNAEQEPARIPPAPWRERLHAASLSGPWSRGLYSAGRPRGPKRDISMRRRRRRPCPGQGSSVHKSAGHCFRQKRLQTCTERGAPDRTGPGMASRYKAG